MSILASLFRKDINRHIEGVVKADDIALKSLENEVEEYVLTSSIENKLDELLEAYFEKRSGGNGYWISGFFGSGKSHLLKMVSLLLENKKLGDKTVAEIFIDKCPKDNAFLRGKLQKLNGQAQSILFDISKVANINNKKDTVLEIFMNQFNEACGYCGTSREVAQFERELDEEGLLEAFKKEFETLSGMSWRDGRIRQRCRPDIDKVYNKIHGTTNSYQDVLEKTKDANVTSIEIFAKLVKAYLDKRGSDFRINFLADEVGQYIGSNVQYMLELQAITEKLGVECNGRACVLVTSQAQVADFLEDMGTNLSRDDFSKIQGRFITRLHLDSQDVEEVIQRRLLEKQEIAKQELRTLYQAQVNNFKTLFDFTDGQIIKNFKDEDHFINCYPFIPYQFTLFQNAMLELSRHGAFQGQYTSVGARSILGVFQQVAIEVSKNGEVGEIATFDMMYAGISSSLAKFQSSIASAERNLDYNPLAIKILKALFLVKYIKTFKATLHNITVLMHSNFNENQVQFSQDIEEALNLLEKETYIQRTNDVYEFLTDKEQEIEQDIKKTEISTTDVPDELQKLIFDGILKLSKIRHPSGTDYPFTRKLDDEVFNRESELAINIITPLNNDKIDYSTIKMKSIEKTRELFILLQKDKKLFDDLDLYKRTNKYLQQNTSSGLSEEVRRIIQEKKIQNSERYNRLQERIASVISKSSYYVNGSEVEKTGTDAAGCIIKAFCELVNKNYSGLRMLGGINYTDKEIDSIIESGDTFLQPNLSEAEQEVFNSIFRNDTYKSTVKIILDKFKKIPYGWSDAAILCQIAHLYARRKIEIKENSNILEDNEVARLLRNTAKQDNLMLSATTSFTPNQIRQLKDFYQSFCNEPISDNDAKTIAGKVNNKLKATLEQVTGLLYRKDNYPFIGKLEVVKDLLRKHIDKQYTWYFNEFTKDSDDLLDMADGLIAPISNFMNGIGKKYFDDAKGFVASEQENIKHINADVTKISQTLADNNCYKGNTIQLLREQVTLLQSEISQKLTEEKQKAASSIAKLKAELTGAADWNNLSDEAKNRLTNRFDTILQNIQNQKIIPMVEYILNKFEDEEFIEINNQKEAYLHPTPVIEPNSSSSFEPTIVPQREVVISLSKLSISHKKSILASEQDVDEYLESIKKAMLGEIKSGKKIKI